jgi:16S rRNA (guanine966-N2)-methyltransferase
LRHETELKSLPSSRNHPKSPLRKSANQLRIIGGQWRGRKLQFPSVDGLRPTPDRVRETLFNWLAPDIQGARCLDLFAGSGALGLEALSRGASFCCFVDASPPATRQIAANLEALACDRATLHSITALSWLQQFDPNQHPPFDILFLDPPFGQNLLAKCLEVIAQNPVLSPDGLAYMETGQHEPLPTLPPGWQLHREKNAGQVSYRLYTMTAK